jgi:transmembrane sensor
MDVAHARDLIRKYREGSLTQQEKAWLESWYLELASTQRDPPAMSDLEGNLEAIWATLPIHESSADKPVLIMTLRRWIAVAASTIILFSVGGYWFYRKQPTVPVAESIYGDDVVPGDNRAILTLADGARISLDRAKNGELAREGNTSIIKTKAGQLLYQSMASMPAKGSAPIYNTIVTPKAGQYQITLPDGTRVWLNAASSMRFPSTFSDKERFVEVMGEVYFEVAKVTSDRGRIPFKVLTGGQLIEVLGTSFNVNSYKDEGLIRTTLVEGSVKVKSADNSGSEILLKPGQQSQFTSAVGSQVDVKEVNTLSVIAWKDGVFRFDNVSLPELMRQLSRWYDVEVVYTNPVREHEFVGQIERGTRLSKVLQILEMGDVHFKVEGKKIVVMD